MRCRADCLCQCHQQGCGCHERPKPYEPNRPKKHEAATSGEEASKA